MAQDPYGNEIIDPFDKAIAEGVIKSTWQSAIVGLVLALTSGCCFGVGQLANPTVAMALVGVVSFLSLAACANVVLRVLTMQPEHKRILPSWQPWGALGMAVVAGCISGLQLLLLVGTFLFAALLGG